MIYFWVFIGLLFIELAYFKIALRYHIFDRPNDRSSHAKIALRGGGIVFYFAMLAYFILSGFPDAWFFIGLSVVSAVSFLDDVFSISKWIRIIVQLLSIAFLFYGIGIFSIVHWWWMIAAFILITGVVNAFNFMDGINGITVANALAIFSLLIIVNQNTNALDASMLYYGVISLLIFGFFNFRQKAVSFAGDVGSVSIAYVLIFLVLLLVVKTGNASYFLFFVVYGIDTFWTIVERLLKKENIFQAHRLHLYQLLSNEAGNNKLLVSTTYGLLQFAIGLVAIQLSAFGKYTQLLSGALIIILLSLFYFYLKRRIKKKYIENKLPI